MSEPLMKNQYIGLKTIYHTPHICGNCLEHIGDNWLYCLSVEHQRGLQRRTIRRHRCFYIGRNRNDRHRKNNAESR